METKGIEGALDALLRAMVKDEAKWPVVPIAASPLKFFDLSEPVSTRAKMEVTQILRQPVYFALRLAVRRMGQQAFSVTGSTDGMREVAERVAGMVPAQYGRRASMLDSAWDGIGSDADRWWS